MVITPFQTGYGVKPLAIFCPTFGGQSTIGSHLFLTEVMGVDPEVAGWGSMYVGLASSLAPMAAGAGWSGALLGSLPMLAVGASALAGFAVGTLLDRYLPRLWGSNKELSDYLVDEATAQQIRQIEEGWTYLTEELFSDRRKNRRAAFDRELQEKFQERGEDELQDREARKRTENQELFAKLPKNTPVRSKAEEIRMRISEWNDRISLREADEIQVEEYLEELMQDPELSIAVEFSGDPLEARWITLEDRERRETISFVWKPGEDYDVEMVLFP